jgi:hypothetical protein
MSPPARWCRGLGYYAITLEVLASPAVSGRAAQGERTHLAVPCRDGNRQDLDAPGQLGIEFKITARRSRLKGFGSKADKLPAANGCTRRRV